MSNYKYKNISLNTILQSNDKNTNSQYGYKGLPNLNPSNYANYNYMRPLFLDILIIAEVLKIDLLLHIDNIIVQQME